MTAMKVIVAAIALMAAIIAYAWFLASITPQGDADRIHREYAKWKRRKERKKYDRD